MATIDTVNLNEDYYDLTTKVHKASNIYGKKLNIDELYGAQFFGRSFTGNSVDFDGGELPDGATQKDFYLDILPGKESTIHRYFVISNGTTQEFFRTRTVNWSKWQKVAFTESAVSELAETEGEKLSFGVQYSGTEEANPEYLTCFKLGAGKKNNKFLKTKNLPVGTEINGVKVATLESTVAKAEKATNADNAAKATNSVNATNSEFATKDADGNNIVATYATIADTYTKEQVNALVSSVYRYKGSVATFSDLPTKGNQVGDVYDVRDTGLNFAWDGTRWDELGINVNLDEYAKKEELTSGAVVPAQSVDSSKLGGVIASSYATKTDLNNKVIDASHGGSGKTNLKDSGNAYINSFEEGTVDMVDEAFFVTSGTSTKNQYLRRNGKFVWNWIKSKISSVLGLTSTDYSGKAATATALVESSGSYGPWKASYGGDVATNPSFLCSWNETDKTIEAASTSSLKVAFATNAGSASNATTATNSTQLGGVDSSKYALKSEIPVVPSLAPYAKTVELKDGTLVVKSATNAVNATTATNSTQLGGVAAAKYALKSEIPTVPSLAPYAKTADLENGTITVKNATNAEVAANAGYAGNSAQLGGVVASKYALKTDVSSSQGVFDLIMPIGKVVQQLPGEVDPNKMYNKGASLVSTWEDITATYNDKFFKISTSVVGTKTDESLPNHKHTRGEMNITGHIRPTENTWMDVTPDCFDGCFYVEDTGIRTIARYSSGKYHSGNAMFDASRSWTGETSFATGTVYQDGAKVQPDNVSIKLWKRTK